MVEANNEKGRKGGRQIRIMKPMGQEEVTTKGANETRQFRAIRIRLDQNSTHVSLIQARARLEMLTSRIE